MTYVRVDRGQHSLALGLVRLQGELENAAGVHEYVEDRRLTVTHESLPKTEQCEYARVSRTK